MDLDYVYPLYDPSRFPKNAAFADIAFAGDHSPEAGILSAWAGLMEAGLKEEELAQELEQKDLKLLLPFTPNASVGLLCNEPTSTLGRLDGAQTRVSGGVQDQQLEALGASPVSLPYSEQYQALQRGTIDCALNTPATSQGLGLLEVAPHFTAGAETGFARVAAPYVFGLAKWESLALPYRQLIFDRLGTWVEALLEFYVNGTRSAAKQMQSAGGEIQPLGDEANAALDKKNKQLLARIGEGDTFEKTDLAQNALDALEKWQRMAVDMGFSEAPLSEWAKSEETEFDAGPFVERFWDDVASEYRPD